MLVIKRSGNSFEIISSNKKEAFLLPTDLLRVVISFWTVIKYKE